MRWNGKAVFKRLENKLKKAQNEAPKILANEGQKVFLENFKTESWNNNPWEKREKDTGRPILIGRTRRLINSVRRSVRVANVSRIKWASDVPYAAVHNYGEDVHIGAHSKIVHFRERSTNIETKKTRYVFASNRRGRKSFRATSAMKTNVGAHTIKMPKRQFMGDSYKLRSRLKGKMGQVFKSNLK